MSSKLKLVDLKSNETKMAKINVSMSHVNVC